MMIHVFDPEKMEDENGGTTDSPELEIFNVDVEGDPEVNDDFVTVYFGNSENSKTYYMTLTRSEFEILKSKIG